MTTVLASGVFDLIHYGHIRFLEEAKRQGGPDARLIVVVARDETVIRLKGRKPIIPEDQRRALVEALKVVDEALLGYEDIDFASVIERLKPDIVAVGHDQGNIETMIKRVQAVQGLNIKIMRIGRFGQSDLNSSSKIKRKIIEDLRPRP